MPRASLITSLLAALLAAGCGAADTPPTVATKFTTQYGMGPDKWATAWLLQSFGGRGAEVEIVPAGTALPDDAIAFDVQDASIKRSADKAALEVALQQFNVADSDARLLGRMIHEIEVDFWSAPSLAESVALENAYRELQMREGGAEVPAWCYLRFFDHVYQQLQQHRIAGSTPSPSDFRFGCDSVLAGDEGRRLVPEVPIAALLGELRRGKRVVFVDVREPEEYQEAHIPGAVNLPIRDLDSADIGALEDADYVVAYCVKDFRGFEMAKMLRSRGITGASILRPYGIRGWIAAGLPVTGTQALEQDQAMARLTACVERGACGGTTL